MEQGVFRPRHEGDNAVLQARAIVALARHPERGQHLDAPLPEQAEWPGNYGKYFDAAMRLAADALHAVKDHPDQDLVARPAVTHGYRAMFMLLERSASVYGKYCDATDREASVEELAGILHRSYDTMELFARLDNRHNRTWETNFGLRGEQQYGIDEFYIDDTEGTLQLKLSPEILDMTDVEISRRERMGELQPQNPRDICPAVGEPLQGEWCRAIQLCAADPNLFATDISKQLVVD